jgi:hypothetical protein
MARATNPQSTGSPLEAIDDLSKPPTGFVSAPFVQQPVGPFWEPPVQEVQPDDPVVLKTLARRVQSRVSSLMRNQVSTNTFVDGLTPFGFPIFVILNLLTKMGFVFEKNGNQMVQRTNMTAFVKALILMKERVDFFLAVIERLRLDSIEWKTLLIEIPISKDEINDFLRLFTSLGFNSGLDNELSLPASWSSLSMVDCSNQVWTVVSQWDWDLPLPAKKRSREDDLPPQNCKNRMFSLEELMRTVLSRLTLSLLATHGVRALSLNDFFWTAFLDMSPEHLRQMMEFLSNDDTLWRLQRILMEVPHLNVKIHNKDLCLSMGDKFTFISFNMSEMLTQFNGLFLEAIMMRQIAGQELHEQEVREAQERQRVERFRTALWVLWRTKNINVFFQELIAVSPEFNSFTTNWGLLKVVVGEFILNIYNATTRAYHNRAPCNNPLIHFLEYAITRGVFTELPEEGAFVRICDCSLENCIFGNKCSGVHQEVVNKHWRPSGWCFGQCCSEYMNSGKCSNSSCKCAHANLWEILRAYKHGSSDSKMKRELLLQALLKN